VRVVASELLMSTRVNDFSCIADFCASVRHEFAVSLLVA
jgi:hypothetical protein